MSKFTRDNNVLVEFTSDSCAVKDMDKKVPLLEGILRDGSCQLQTTDKHFTFFNKDCFKTSTANVVLVKTNTQSDEPFSNALHVNNADLLTWHRTLVHPCTSTIFEIFKTLMLKNCNVNKLPFCVDCQLGKAYKLPFPKSVYEAVAPLELIHSDI